MNYRQTIAHIAKKLPHQSQQDVKEVVDLLLEAWIEELVSGEKVTLPDFGTLSISVQQVNARGVVSKAVQRIYGRFRLAGYVKEKLHES